MHEAGIHPRWDTSPLQGSIIHVHLYSFTSRGNLSSPVHILAGFWSLGEVFPQNCATFASMSLNYGLSEFVFCLSLYLVPVCLTLLLLSYIRLKKIIPSFMLLGYMRLLYALLRFMAPTNSKPRTRSQELCTFSFFH